MDAPCVEIQILDCFALLACAKDDSERGLLGRLALVAIEPAQVQLHLTGVCGFEVTDLELDGYEAPHPSMKEQEVEVVVVAIERDALLPSNEREARAELEEEMLHLSEDRGLEVLLAVRVGKLEEVEHVRIAEYERGGELALVLKGG